MWDVGSADLHFRRKADSPAGFGQAEPPMCEHDASRLRAVFDALDRDGDGFVRMEEFVQFATVYGAEQVKELTKYLDPSGLGVISFEDFNRGIAEIRNGDPDLQLYDMGYSPEEDPPACADEFDDFVTFEAWRAHIEWIRCPDSLSWKKKWRHFRDHVKDGREKIEMEIVIVVI